MSLFNRLVLAVLFCSALFACRRGDTDELIDHKEINELPEDEIYYTSDLSGKLEIYRQRGDGMEQVTSSDQFDNWWPRLSPDGSTMLYYQSIISREMNDYHSASLRLLDFSSLSSREIYAKGKDGWKAQGMATWSADGLMAFAAIEANSDHWQVYVCDQNGDSIIKVSPHSNRSCFDPAFGEDSKTIFYSSTPLSDSTSGRYEIFKFDRSSGRELQMTYNGRRNHHPHLSPDGTKLIYESLVDPDYLGIGKWAIMELDLATGAEKSLISTDPVCLYPRFNRSGTYVYYISMDVSVLKLQLMRYQLSTGHKELVELSEGSVYSVDLR